MAGDYSRNGFHRKDRVSAVLMQQGRVTLDSDQNTEALAVDRRIRNLAQDVWGKSWVPARTTPDAFRLTPIAGPDLAIGAGRLYAFGLVAEVFPEEAATLKAQPFLPGPFTAPAAGPALAYLDVFEREVTWVEQPELLEKALHGVDTTTRRQVAWQVKLHSAADAACGMDLDALFPPGFGRLTTDATGTPASDDPCILPPTGGYRGLENRFYRVQVHVAGATGTALFKWSRENASVVSPVETIATSGTESQLRVTRIGRDQVLRFSAGDWVEVLDDRRELSGAAGEMARVLSIDEATRTVFLDRAMPLGGTSGFGTTPAALAAAHTRLIRWDQSLERHGNAVDPSTGLMTTGPLPIALEDGVQVGFSAAAGTSGVMRVGDHWSFAARTVDGSVEKLEAAPPDGVRHHYVPLAEVTVGPGGFVVTRDCREPVPPKGGGGERRPSCECCTICVGEDGDVPDLRAALAALPALAPSPATPVRICLLPGDHLIPDGLEINRPNTRIVGCFPRSRLIVRGAGLRFTADATGIEEVVVIGGAERGMVGFEGMSDGFARACQVLAVEGTFALAANKVRRLSLTGNRLEGAGIMLFGGSREVEIEGNAIEKFRTSAIVIDEEAGAITILSNRLTDGLGCGIEVGKRADQLRITGNEITMCRGEKTFLGGAAGGIVVLDSVDGLIVQDNRIEGNASDAPKDAAGIFVARGTAILISRNRILGNGRAEMEEAAVAGGIVITAVSPPVDVAGAAPRRFDPALIVEGNVVAAERGQALLVIGQGDMRVQNNTLISRLGTARGVGPNDLGIRDLASILMIGIERLGGFAEKLIDAAAGGPEAPLHVVALAEEIRVSVPGRVLVHGNQMALERQLVIDRERPTLAAVAIYGFEDVDLAHNQVELDRDEARFCVNALIVGRTVRQLGNRLTEPPEAALASLLSLGFDLNTCTQNQGSHCILPRSPAQLVDRYNLVEFPSELCPRG